MQSLHQLVNELNLAHAEEQRLARQQLTFHKASRHAERAQLSKRRRAFRKILRRRARSRFLTLRGAGRRTGQLPGTSLISDILMTGTGARPQDHVGGQIVGQNPASDRLS